MKRITLPIIGTGKEGDYRRVDLPTYQMVSESDDGLYATVDVPDADFPDVPSFREGKPHPAGGFVIDAKRMAVGDVQAWHDHLDERYAEHAGKFRPGV